MGSGQGTNSYEGGVDKLNDTWYFDPADLHDGDNVLTVVLDPTGEFVVSSHLLALTRIMARFVRRLRR